MTDPSVRLNERVLEAIEKLPKVEGDFSIESDVYIRTKDTTHILSSGPLVELLRLRQGEGG